MTEHGRAGRAAEPEGTAARSTGAAPPARRRRRTLLSWVLFPGLVTAVFLVLVGADLNGSSVGLLRETAGADPNLLLGEPRPVRSDELLIATPLAVSAARQGFPERPYVGLTRIHPQAVPHAGPARSAFEAFKPQDWGYLALGAHRGLAVHWWFPFLASLVGVFWLLRSLRVAPLLASALAVVATMTPYNAWWSSPAPGLQQGYAALAAAAAIAGFRSASRRATIVRGLLAGVAATALFLTLYPPWLISLGLVVVALLVGVAVDARVGWRRPLLTVAGAAAVALPVLGAWYLTNRDAIAATAGTFYPGQQAGAPGGAVFGWLLTAPLNPLLAGDAGATLDPAESGVPFTNLSEISASWLPVPVLVAALVAVVVRHRRSSSGQPPAAEGAAEGAADGGADGGARPGTWTVVSLSLVMALLLLWALAPLPEWTGTLLLERVKATRVPLALGLAAVLVVAVAGSAGPRRRPRVGEGVLWAAGIAATVALSLWAAARMPWNENMVPARTVLAASLVVAAGFGLVAAGWWRRTAAVVLAVFAAWSWGLVNPLYQGLGPLDSDPLARVLRPLAEERPGAVAMVFGDERLVAIVRGSGLQSLAGTTPYPDADLMRRLVPDQRGLWNNYVTYRWKADPAATPARIRQVRGTTMELSVNPCAPEIAGLGATWAVADQPLEASCLRPRQTVRSGELTRYVYEVRR